MSHRPPTTTHGRLDRADVVSVLDEDPDLAAGVDPSELAAARRRAVAVIVHLPPAAWDTSELERRHPSGWLGLFVLEGLILRRVRVGRRVACELFGPGDVVRPWDADDEYEPLPIAVDWLVLRAVRMAVLDDAFLLRVAPWPQISSQVAARVARRARYLTLTDAVTRLPRAYARLLILFWLLAERWGRVGPDGVHVTLPVTHEVLAMLIGSRRPTVTIALQRLSRAGYLIRERRDRWLLSNEAIECLTQPESLDLAEDCDGVRG